MVYVSDFHLHHLSPPLKAVLDRAIPLRRAYLMVGKNGHMGHYPRYPLHHRGILLVEAHPDLDDGDLKAMAASCGGHKSNFDGAFRLDQPAKEICHAIDHR